MKLRSKIVMTKRTNKKNEQKEGTKSTHKKHIVYTLHIELIK